MTKEMKMEFIDEIATQMTELYFQEDTFAPSSEVGQENVLMFTEEAQYFYNERYDEIETLYDSINNRLDQQDVKDMVEGFRNNQTPIIGSFDSNGDLI